MLILLRFEIQAAANAASFPRNERYTRRRTYRLPYRRVVYQQGLREDIARRLLISHSQIAGGTGHYCRCIAFVNAYAQFCLLSRRMWISVTSAALVTGRRWMTREGNCSGACCWALSKPASELSPSWVLVRPRLLLKMQSRDFYFRRLQPMEFRISITRSFFR